MRSEEAMGMLAALAAPCGLAVLAFSGPTCDMCVYPAAPFSRDRALCRAADRGNSEAMAGAGGGDRA